MLMAFVTVIFLGLCGMATVFVLSSRATQGTSSQDFRPPWAAAQSTPVVPLLPSESGKPLVVPPSSGFRGGTDWRGPVSALLTFAAVLIGAATFFSRRVTR